jgi:aspartyl-tRNA synthetase
MSYRTANNGELRIDHVSNKVTLCGWVQKTRNLGGMTFVDLRDRYGITQLVFNMDSDEELCVKARGLGREYVIKIEGIVVSRSSVNKLIPTGEIEIEVNSLVILNASKTPPFTIEDETDGGDDLRMEYRYLDLRRRPVQDNIILRSDVAFYTRNFLKKNGFLEIETPVLIKSTPEGARDFVVPSRLNLGEFYALPQSPQTFKQLLMVSGYDKYYQIVKCFRDEDFRADRQPEFTQIDCEMAFVKTEDILHIFEHLIKEILFKTKGIKINKVPRMTYQQAIKDYGTDKPDLRFEMKVKDLNTVCKGKGFQVFDSAESILGLVIPGGVAFSRKQIDKLTDWVKRPQIGASGLIYCKFNNDSAYKSSVDKFFTLTDLEQWKQVSSANDGDMLLIIAGEEQLTINAIGNLRLEVANQLNLRDPNKFAPVWITDFPLFELDKTTGNYHAMHHPFTSPNEEDMELLNTDPELVRANAYDMALNGTEIGGGSIRIHDKDLQKKVFNILGFTDEEAQDKFGFLMKAFEYGAPPHGGIAFGLDRICAVISGSDSIRDFIAFPKNNSGRDVMLNAPSKIDNTQLDELGLNLD